MAQTYQLHARSAEASLLAAFQIAEAQEYRVRVVEEPWSGPAGEAARATFVDHLRQASDAVEAAKSLASPGEGWKLTVLASGGSGARGELTMPSTADLRVWQFQMGYVAQSNVATANVFALAQRVISFQLNRALEGRPINVHDAKNRPALDSLPEPSPATPGQDPWAWTGPEIRRPVSTARTASEGLPPIRRPGAEENARIAEFLGEAQPEDGLTGTSRDLLLRDLKIQRAQPALKFDTSCALAADGVNLNLLADRVDRPTRNRMEAAMVLFGHGDFDNPYTTAFRNAFWKIVPRSIDGLPEGELPSQDDFVAANAMAMRQELATSLLVDIKQTWVAGKYVAGEEIQAGEVWLSSKTVEELALAQQGQPWAAQLAENIQDMCDPQSLRDFNTAATAQLQSASRTL